MNLIKRFIDFILNTLGVIDRVKTVFYAILIIIAIYIVGNLTFPYYTDDYVVSKVTKTERVTIKGDNYYTVFTKDGEYKVTDNFRIFRWNSSKVYGQIREGNTYKIHYYGFRIPFFSVYPNIIDVEEVTVVGSIKNKLSQKVKETIFDYAVNQITK